MTAYSKKHLSKIFYENNSKSDIAKKLNLPLNGKTNKLIEKLASKFDLTIPSYKKSSKHKIIIKVCPVCKKSFETFSGGSKETTTCSYSCANTYFRSGKNHPNWKNISDQRERKYRDICFAHHDKKCVICEESKIVEVHHLDGDHSNELPENLIPLCPTHHKYWHSKYQHLIKNKIYDYVAKFKSAK